MSALAPNDNLSQPLNQSSTLTSTAALSLRKKHVNHQPRPALCVLSSGQDRNAAYPGLVVLVLLLLLKKKLLRIVLLQPLRVSLVRLPVLLLLVARL